MKVQQGQQYKGFLLSCEQNREKQAIKDAYNFLNEFIEKLYPDLEPTGSHKKHNTGNSLEQQLKELKKKENRVLFSIETGVKCLIFIKINPLFLEVDPIKVVESIMEAMKQDRQVTRYCHKVLPVQKAFRAEFFHMKNAVEDLMSKMSKGQKKSWALHFKCRNNDKFKYKEIVTQVTKIASQFGHFTQIYYPQWTICIQICNHLMCISIVEKFKESNEYKLRKINVTPLERVNQQQIAEKQKQKSETQKQKNNKQQNGQQQKEEASQKLQSKQFKNQKIQIGQDDVQFV